MALACRDRDRIRFHYTASTGDESDRLERFFNTRVRFEPRELPAADAAEFVAVAVASVRQKIEADVVMRLPIDEMTGYFGPWARGAEPVDGDRTRWPIGGRTPQELMTALAWVPEAQPGSPFTP